MPSIARVLVTVLFMNGASAFSTSSGEMHAILFLLPSFCSSLSSGQRALEIHFRACHTFCFVRFILCCVGLRFILILLCFFITRLSYSLLTYVFSD